MYHKYPDEELMDAGNTNVILRVECVSGCGTPLPLLRSAFPLCRGKLVVCTEVPRHVEPTHM